MASGVNAVAGPTPVGRHTSMKVISIASGRATRHFVADEVGPRAGFYIHDVIRLIGERYGFINLPSISDAAKSGVVFQNGRLIAGNKKMNISNLGIYNDAITVMSFDTDSAEFILDDIVNWAWSTFDLREPVTAPTTIIESNIVVEFERSIDHILAVFDGLSQAFTSALRQAYERDISVHLSRIGVGGDPQELKPYLRAEIVLERRIGHPYAENRYFSVAPLRTAKHIEILEALEHGVISQG